MKIHMVSLEDGITATGFRRIAAYVEKINPDTRIFYVGTRRYLSLWKLLSRRIGETSSFGADEVEEIAAGVAGADIVAFSSMTAYSGLTRAVAKRVREINPQAFTVWGGIHPIIYPEDAISATVDAICTGEGEFAFEEFLRHFEEGTDYGGVPGFWFRPRGCDEIRRNPFRPLMSSADLASLPFSKYGGDESVYRPGRGFISVTRSDYLANNGLGFPVIWSIGCPMHCTYCGNTVFIANDAEYRRLRHSGVDHIIGEVSSARAVHPHIRTVLFYDDSFMALPLRDLSELAERWRTEVGLPFCVFGVVPSFVRRDKLEILTWAGMNRVRMGIESGSNRILEFYKRPTPVELIEKAARALAEFADYHINPTYDIIVDNPVETRQDVVDTLELVYRMARPFSLSIFSLRVIPNTTLEKQMLEQGFDLDRINDNYRTLRPTLANVLLHVLMLWRPPRKLFDGLLKNVRACNEAQKSFKLLLHLVRIPWLLQQGFRHLKHGEFTAITGFPGYLFWRIGLLAILRRSFVRRFELPVDARPPLAAGTPGHEVR